MKTLIKKNTQNGWIMPSMWTSPFSLLDEVMNDNLFGRDCAVNVPNVNISENSGNFMIELSAPGFEKENFKIETKDGVLIVSAEKKEENSFEDKRFSRKEFSYGSFRRSFELSEDVNEESISASYENGILKVSLPKKEEVKRTSGREIKVG